MVAYGISYLPAHVEDDDRVLLEKGEKEQWAITLMLARGCNIKMFSSVLISLSSRLTSGDDRVDAKNEEFEIH